jgi:dGTPase
MAEDALFLPPDWLEREESVLAPYAMRTRWSRGRAHAETDHPYRTPYQRDRDRIVHSTAFRRLMHKTQVLITQTNDHHRTRLTHTLEVAQIARTLARCLGLNEDLTEAIALSHDLGHPPFGHAGEAALNECMAEHGGFEHNRHGLRLVETLEYPYAAFPGLNLTWEVREAMAQHSRRRDAPEIAAYRAAGAPLLEAQVADAADGLAYDAHDVDDALGVGLIALDDLGELEVWRRSLEQARQRHGALGPEQFRTAVVRSLINWQVGELLEHTRRRLAEAGVRSVEDVRRTVEPLVAFGPQTQALRAELEDFLHRRVYQHYRVQRMALKGRRIVTALFTEFRRAPQLLPDRYRRRVGTLSAETVACDYVAGMTDRYAQDEYLRLFQPYSVV